MVGKAIDYFVLEENRKYSTRKSILFTSSLIVLLQNRSVPPVQQLKLQDFTAKCFQQHNKMTFTQYLQFSICNRLNLSEINIQKKNSGKLHIQTYIAIRVKKMTIKVQVSMERSGRYPILAPALTSVICSQFPLLLSCPVEAVPEPYIYRPCVIQPFVIV